MVCFIRLEQDGSKAYRISTMTESAKQNGQQHLFGKPPESLPAWLPAPPERKSASGLRLDQIDLGNHLQRNRFLKMVPPLYAGDENFINPLWLERMMFLNPKRNASLANLEIHALLAYRGTACVGRVTAHIDHAYNRYHQSKTGWFGFFESENDASTAHALFDEGIRWLKERGMSEVFGPNNFTTNHQFGLLIENFSRPACVEMTYNPPYYQELITSYGFAKAKDLHAYWIDVTGGLDNPLFQRFDRVSQKVKDRYKLKVRHVDLRRFDEEVAVIFRIYNDSWEKNWGFVPVSEREFASIASDFKHLVIDRLVLIVEQEGKPVGFSLTVPDLNEVLPRDGKLLPLGWLKLLRGMKKTKNARLITLGVLPAYRKRGVEAILCLETALRTKRLGMKGGEISWTLEDNHLINSAAEAMGGKLDRKYRVFGMTIN
ncbi:MAG: N-acetyltransferase [Deltaproteobacteria bacterium]|nr:N-acetyltransferase [Deltaproteobacteria bacterium]